MFSRKEREFLRLLSETPVDGTSADLERRFPNPVYRRRLLWGIRKKALAAAGDWELYAQAAGRERRVVNPRPTTAAAEVPSSTEPIAALVQALINSARRNRTPARARTSPEEP